MWLTPMHMETTNGARVGNPMVSTDLAVVQAEVAFRARASGQVEAVFTVRAIRVTREVIIHNLAKVISSNSPNIRATQNS